MHPLHVPLVRFEPLEYVLDCLRYGHSYLRIPEEVSKINYLF